MNRSTLEAAARRIARQQGIPVGIFLSLITHESGWNPGAVSPAGALGLGQLMPGTARGLGVDPRDPIQNLTGAARYFKRQLDAFGSPELALAAYNAGPGAVKEHGGIPPFAETQRYVKNVLADASKYGRTSLPKGFNHEASAAAVVPAPAGMTALPEGPDLASVALGNLGEIAATGRLNPSSSLGRLTEAVASAPASSAPGLATEAPTPTAPAKRAKPHAGIAGADFKVIGLPHQGTHTLGNWESDNAVDLRMPVGTPLYAAFDGQIGQQFGPLNSKDPRMAGLRLHLVGKGDELYYAHLSSFAPGIKPGTRVKRGQLIGFSGSANGTPHLHLGDRNGSVVGRLIGSR